MGRGKTKLNMLLEFKIKINYFFIQNNDTIMYFNYIIYNYYFYLILNQLYIKNIFFNYFIGNL